LTPWCDLFKLEDLVPAGQKLPVEGVLEVLAAAEGQMVRKGVRSAFEAIIDRIDCGRCYQLCFTGFEERDRRVESSLDPFLLSK
jgi:hypothetical protein